MKTVFPGRPLGCGTTRIMCSLQPTGILQASRTRGQLRQYETTKAIQCLHHEDSSPGIGDKHGSIDSPADKTTSSQTQRMDQARGSLQNGFKAPSAPTF